MTILSRAFPYFSALAVLFSAPLFSPVLLSGQAINPAVSFGSVSVGGNTATTLSFAVPANATFSASYGSEFVLGGSSCSNGSCTIPITFQPAYPGIRRGAISAFVGTSQVAVTPVYGIGLAPQLGIGPGVITTVASRTNQFLAGSQVAGVAVRGAGQVYVSDSLKHQVFVVDPRNGQVTVVVGTGVAGFSGDGGLGVSAQLNQPSGLAIDATGNLLIADTNNNRVRKLDLLTGLISTIAGNGSIGSSGDGGPALSASLNSPDAMALLANGDIILADTVNSRIRIISAASGTINAFAGNGAPGFAGDGGPAVNAQLDFPVGVAVDSSDNVYIADVVNRVVRKVTSSGIFTVAGQAGVQGRSGDGGPATSALLSFPYGVAVDGAGDLYISDAQNQTIRKVTGDVGQSISTVAGTGTVGYLGDGGSALLAQINGPSYVTLDQIGNLYFVDSGNLALRELSARPAPVTFPLTSVGSPASAAIIVSNTGNQTLNVSAFNFSSNFTAGAGGCGSTPVLTRGQSCTAFLTFTPTTNGATSGTISLSSNTLNNTASAPTGFAVSQSNGLYFVPVTPCRVVDTRINGNGAFGAPILAAGAARTFAIRNSPTCSSTIPAGADVRAYALNITVVPTGLLDFLTVAPVITGLPGFSTLNSYDGRTKANAAIVPANLADNNRSIGVYATDQTQLIIDINGYYVPQATPGALAYFPLPPCRAYDTRPPTSSGGATVAAGETRNFALRGVCSLPSTAQAYALNFTAIPQAAAPLPFITVWPAGVGQPVVSTLNATTGAITANAAIIPAGSSGNISVFAQAATDLIVDVSGYYAPASSAPSGLALYSTSPCRAFDSRRSGGPINGVTSPNIMDSCSVPPVAQGFVLNATTVPVTTMPYLTLWARGGAQPLQSTLNGYDGAVTSNLAVVPTSDGFISSFTAAPANVIFDVFGYFAP